MLRESTTRGIAKILDNVEISATGETTAPAITPEELQRWGELFESLEEPFRTPAFRLLREAKAHGRKP